MSARFAGALATIAVVSAVAITVASAGAIPARALSARRGSSPHTVVLAHKRFLPGTLSIRPGERVTWLWRDGGVLHNVIGRGFQSRTVTRGSFTLRFTHRGTYSYTCTVHPHMDGSVTVR